MSFSIGNISVDSLTMNGALERVSSLIGKGGVVLTPNVDHVVMCESNHRLRMVYERADLRLPDGMPIVWASKLSKNPLPEKISGSDFIHPLLALSAEKGWRVFLLGSLPNTIDRAIENIKKVNPTINIIGRASPFVSSSVGREEVKAIMETIAELRADIIIVALGAPKQEYFIDIAHAFYSKAVYFGLGASLDFIAGDVPRAPLWMQKSGLEWSYRLYREPKRLFRRYLRDLKFPFIFLKDLLKR